MQTKLSSLLEAIISTAIGFTVSMLVQHLIVTPLYGLTLSVADNFWITMIFTVASILRQYFVRRYFNWRIHEYLTKKA